MKPENSYVSLSYHIFTAILKRIFKYDKRMYMLDQSTFTRFAILISMVTGVNSASFFYIVAAQITKYV